MIQTPKIIAHRGLTTDYPENTLAAFVKAQEAGADKIELDVHESKDGKLVVYHDYLLGKPDSGRGFIREQTGEYIKSLTIQKDSVTEQIPFLNQVFDRLRNSCEYELEMKGTSQSFIEHALETVKKYGLMEYVEFTSPHPYVLTQIKKMQDRAKIGIFVPSFPEWMNMELGVRLVIDNAKLGDIDVLHCPLSILTEASVKQFKSEGFVVHAADCNTEMDIHRALSLHVDQLSTDNPVLALKMRGQK